MKEFWNERFASGEYIYGVTPNAFYKSIIDKLSHNGKALFLAEGEGRNAVYAAQLGYDVTAIDFSTSGKEKAMKLAQKANVNIDYIISSMEQFDFTASTYDLIVLIYAHMTSETRSSIHNKCVKALSPGGKIILEAFNKKQLDNSSGGPKNEDMLYNIGELKCDFNGLNIELAEDTHTHLKEGSFHTGHADIIRIIASKDL